MSGMDISRFGRKITARAGISVLMDDLGAALSSGRDMLMLGGGNPAHIHAVQNVFRESARAIFDSPQDFARTIGDYDPPAGNRAFREAVAGLLHREFDWPVGPEHIALTNGSQTAFFVLFNLFAGRREDGSFRRILLPMTPEYIGYADVGIEEGLFAAERPRMEMLPGRMFKYHVDFERLTIGPDVGAVCVSRPTNPTGNVLTDGELRTLSDMTRAAGVPLIVDNAYGLPFPGIVYSEARPLFEEHTIVCMSLSKLGLPAARTGIVIAHPDIVRLIGEFNAVMSLAPGGIGAAMVTELIRCGAVLEVSREMIRPFYQAKADRAVAALHEGLRSVDYRIHQPEGAFFLWLWLPGLRGTCEQLYQRLKARGVLVVPGHYFFPGLSEDWQHRHQCIRISYAQDETMVRRGIEIIAEEARAMCE